MKLKHDLFSEEDYQAFVDKFKPKKTTDDCYTPPIVYDAIADYVAEYYGLDRSKFVRPFYPGGDYERFEYPDDCVVVDNPPFSIISKIVRDYREGGVRFFLFAPHKSLIGICGKEGNISKIFADAKITYENGANVATNFVTNLEPVPCVRSDPKLCTIVKKADARARANRAESLPVFNYPDEVLTFSQMNTLAVFGVEFSIPLSETCFIRALDSQKAEKKAIYGSGLLLKRKMAEAKRNAMKIAMKNAPKKKAAIEKELVEKKANEKANGVFWKLSDRERAFVEGREWNT